MRLCRVCLFVCADCDTGKGWITHETFQPFIQFFANATGAGNDGKWVMLLVDNHDSRFDNATWDYCAARNILLVALPPNSTPLLQPVDVGPNQRFKFWLKKLSDRQNRAMAVGGLLPDVEHLADLEGEERKLAAAVLAQKWKGPIGRHNVIQRILFPAWRMALTRAHIQRGWRDTGFWPHNRNKVSPTALVPKTVAEAKEMLPEETKTWHVSEDLDELLPLPTEELAEYHADLVNGKRKGRPKQKGARLLTPLGESKVAEQYVAKQSAKAAKAAEKAERKRQREEKKEAKARETERKRAERESKRRRQRKQRRRRRSKRRRQRQQRKSASELCGSGTSAKRKWVFRR